MSCVMGRRRPTGRKVGAWNQVDLLRSATDAGNFFNFIFTLLCSIEIAVFSFDFGFMWNLDSYCIAQMEIIIFMLFWHHEKYICYLNSTFFYSIFRILFLLIFCEFWPKSHSTLSGWISAMLQLLKILGFLDDRSQTVCCYCWTYMTGITELHSLANLCIKFSIHTHPWFIQLAMVVSSVALSCNGPNAAVYSQMLLICIFLCTKWKAFLFWLKKHNRGIVRPWFVKISICLTWIDFAIGSWTMSDCIYCMRTC